MMLGRPSTDSLVVHEVIIPTKMSQGTIVNFSFNVFINLLALPTTPS